MFTRLSASMTLIVLTALLVTLASSDESYGQTKQQKQNEKAAKQAQKDAAKAAKAQEKKNEEVRKAEFKGQEAELLRKVYILMNGADADYAGHRVKAMKHVEQACNILDKQIIAKGTDKQVALTHREEAIKEYAKANRHLAGAITEPQIISDAQLYQAGQVLAQLKTVMVQNKQPKVAEQVDKAIAEIKLALATR